jgi:DNA-3-methyladenine glycosylase II
MPPAAEAAARELARRDPVIAAMVRRHGPPALQRDLGSHFAALVRSICFQQLAGRAATAIHLRLLALVDDRPTPENVLALSIDDMRAAGLSANKVASIRDLAAKAAQGTVELDRMNDLDDEIIIAELTTVRGIGVWTAQMFLMFQLGRLNVWPVLDFGVRAGFARLYGHDVPLSPKQMEAEGERFAPFRSVAAWYCWRAVDAAG